MCPSARVVVLHGHRQCRALSTLWLDPNQEKRSCDLVRLHTQDEHSSPEHPRNTVLDMP